MARVCESCGKKPMSGHTISHAHNLTKRRFEANLRKVRAQQPGGGSRRTRVCTRCLRSGKVRKSAGSAWTWWWYCAAYRARSARVSVPMVHA